MTHTFLRLALQRVIYNGAYLGLSMCRFTEKKILKLTFFVVALCTKTAKFMHTRVIHLFEAQTNAAAV